MKQNNKLSLFKEGLTWVRADFHLHTKKDKEFIYKEDKHDFVKKYVKKLVKENIKVGVICNHNKFDINEFKAIRKVAKKENIFLLPGVELSVNDGANGIHVVIVFEDDWIINTSNTNNIDNFLKATFAGKENYESGNSRSNHNLVDTIKLLNDFGLDYFFVLAHVENRCGFLNELDGGRIKEFRDNELFMERALSFQKIRTQDKIDNLKKWWGGYIPTLVEGSDPKKIDEIGRGNKQTYIKIGEYNFDSIKYSLINKNRLSEKMPVLSHSFVNKVSFVGGKLDGKDFFLNSGLNNIIGIRGSGKSSILETIRYGLNVELSDNSADIKYKKGIVEHLLGSGGKVILDVVEPKNGKKYKIERILNEFSIVSCDGKVIDNLTVESIINNPKYFGQKDLSYNEDSFNEDFVRRVVGNNEEIMAISKDIEACKVEIETLLQEIDKLENIVSSKDGLTEEKAGIEHKLKIYKEKKIDKKLKNQTEFIEDEARVKEILDTIEEYNECFVDIVNEYDDNEIVGENECELEYNSDNNKTVFVKLEKEISGIKSNYVKLKEVLEKFKKSEQNIQTLKNTITKNKESLIEEFSKIKREIDVDEINLDDFLVAQKRLKTIVSNLDKISKKHKKKEELETKLKDKLAKLNKLWHKEFTAINKEVKRINSQSKSLKIEVGYKEGKEKYEIFLSDNLRGCNIKKINLKKLVDAYSDLIEIYNDLIKDGNSNSNIIKILSGGSQLLNFRDKFFENLKDFVTFRPPDKYTIYFNGKELQKHSIGQRASALILFVLSQKNNDIVIIDQPEDDLDSQSVYNEVISILREIKKQIQFIFVTHSPNIPVLGDAEQVIKCDYFDKEISINCGSIDCKEIQKDIIDVMEGGQEAFEKRRDIYYLWDTE